MKLTKLNSKNVRYYNPSTGRFLSADPIGFKGGDTNLYRYVLDNPVNLIDSRGTDGIVPRVLFCPALINCPKTKEKCWKSKGIGIGDALDFPAECSKEQDEDDDPHTCEESGAK